MADKYIGDLTVTTEMASGDKMVVEKADSTGTKVIAFSDLCNEVSEAIGFEDLETAFTTGCSTIAQAVTDNGVATAATDSPSTIATNIGLIRSTGNAAASDIASGKTAWVNKVLVTGTGSGGGPGNTYTIEVSCTSGFAGATITCTDGTSTYTKTCPSSSPYEVAFNNLTLGTWTISTTVSGLSYSEVVDIATTYDVAFVQTPVGSTVTPTDDAQIWLNCAGIFDKPYSNFEGVLTDPPVLYELLANANAMEYLVRSTTWASDFAADVIAINYLALLDDALDKLVGDVTWADAIANSPYSDALFPVTNPKMTSNTAPSGVASAQSHYSTLDAYMAFDENLTTNWLADADTANNASSTQWIQYMFTENVKVNRFDLTGYNYTYPYTGVKLCGSLNGTTFVDLYEDTKERRSAVGTYETWKIGVPNTEYYKYYRLYITQKNVSGSMTRIPMIRELKFYGRSAT